MSAGGVVDAEERAEIRARAEKGWTYPGIKATEVLDLLAALDVCEAERDRAVEALLLIQNDLQSTIHETWVREVVARSTEESNE
jgi:hypothetical protein